MKETIKAIVTDLGGVLMRTVDRIPRTTLANRFGMTYDELDSLVFNSFTGNKSQDGSVSDDDHWQFLRETLHLEDHERGNFFKDFFSGDTLDEGLLEFIHSFNGRYKLGLLSNAWKMSAVQLRVDYRIDKWFDSTIFSAEVGTMKPHAPIYHLMEKSLDVHSSQILFLDDNPVNLEGAAIVGWQVIQYINTPQSIQSIKKALESE